MTAAEREELRDTLAGFSESLPMHTGPACDFSDGVRADDPDVNDGDPLLGLDYTPSDAGPILADLMVRLVNMLPRLLADSERLARVTAERDTAVELADARRMELQAIDGALTPTVAEWKPIAGTPLRHVARRMREDRDAAIARAETAERELAEARESIARAREVHRLLRAQHDAGVGIQRVNDCYDIADMLEDALASPDAGKGAL